tara:strand:- start:195 stop:749 length:555 start_codon:yes stop_codon:yes gene_type:complete
MRTYFSNGSKKRFNKKSLKSYSEKDFYEFGKNIKDHIEDVDSGKIIFKTPMLYNKGFKSKTPVINPQSKEYQESLQKKTKAVEAAEGGRIGYSKGTMPARNKKNFRPTKSGAGMTRAGVKAYRRLNPGSKLKTAVTGKVKPGSKAAKRRKSYCARSLGQLKRASAKTRNDPNSRIRQARRRWKC